MTEDEMVGWRHRLSGQESEQTLGDGERQGSLAGCSSWGCKVSDTTEQLATIEPRRTLRQPIYLYIGFQE